MRELAKPASGDVAALLPQLASIAALTGFAGCRHLQETIWCQLPSIAISVGKRVSSRSLQTSGTSQPGMRNIAFSWVSVWLTTLPAQ